MTVKHVTGDLFALDVDAIGHGVNCRGEMGAGIAVAFKEKYPQMYSAYRRLCQNNDLHLGQVFVWPTMYKGTGYTKHVVYNIASQNYPGPNADLGALLMGLEFVEFDANRRGLKTVALPQIGCGIGGLEWSVVSNAIEILFENSPVEFQLVTYNG